MRFPLIFALLASPAAVAAQERAPAATSAQLGQEPATPQSTIETIVVTAGGNLRQTPGDRVQHVSVIRDFGQGLGARVENRLRDEAGLAQFRRSDGRSAHPTSQGVTMRGLGGNASSRALVLLDGVPQADPFGGWVAWSAFDGVPLAGARIVRGGGSGADGPGALGGTIGLSSRIGDGATLVASGGSRGSSDLFASIGGAIGQGEVALDGRWSRGDGFVPIVAGDRGLVDRAAPFDQSALGLRARFDAGPDGRIEVAVRGWRDRRDRGTDFSRSAVDGFDASIRYILDPAAAGGWRASLLGYAQLREFETGFASVAADRNSVVPALNQRVPALGLGARLEVRPPLGSESELRLGLDWRQVEGETQEGFFFTGTVPGRRREAGGSSRTLGLFGDWSYQPGDVMLTLSGRLDHWRIAPGFRIERNIGGTLRSDERFAARSGWEATARAGAAWEAGDWTLRTAAYTGWRLPTLNELYRPFRVGADATAANELLRPERLWGGEAGLEWADGSGNGIAATAFWNRLDHAIANVTLGRGPGTFPGVGVVAAGGSYARRQNLDAIRAQGIEVQGQAQLGPVALRMTYALTDAQVRASGTALALDGRRPAQVARHAASLSAIVTEAFGSADLRLRYIGAQNEDDLGAQRLGDAFTVDAGAKFAISETFSLLARAENLFDALVPAAIGAGGAIERTAPRTLWLGLSAEF